MSYTNHICLFFSIMLCAACSKTDTAVSPPGDQNDRNGSSDVPQEIQPDPAEEARFKWGQIEFFAPTAATVPLLGSTGLQVQLERENGQTVYILKEGGPGSGFFRANARNAEELQEFKRMLAKATDWATKAKENNVSELPAKVMFTFKRGAMAGTDVRFWVRSGLGSRGIQFWLGYRWRGEDEWPALRFVANHVADLFPLFEKPATAAEQRQSTDKKKADELFRP